MIDSNPPAFILGSGVNALGLVRPLGRNGIRCVVFDQARKDIVYCSRFCEVVVLERRDDEALLDALENHTKSKLQHPVLYATGDPDIRFLVRNRERLKERFRFVAPPRMAIDTLTDKALFASFINQHGFPSPGTVVASEIADIDRATAELNFPVIIKPAFSADWQKSDVEQRFGTIKMVRAENSDELYQIWRNFGDTSHALIVQELIPGTDDQQFHYFSYRDRNAREVSGLIARRLRIWPIHAGVGSLVVAEHNPELAGISRQILDALHFVGPSSVCFKRHRDTGEYKIFEINGRFTQQNSIFSMCNVDLPGIYYSDALGRKMPEVRFTNIGRKWMSLELDPRASLEYWRAGELSVFGYLRSLLGTSMVVELARDDWGPFRFILREITTEAQKNLTLRLKTILHRND